jgi:hypothetical protein
MHYVVDNDENYMFSRALAGAVLRSELCCRCTMLNAFTLVFESDVMRRRGVNWLNRNGASKFGSGGFAYGGESFPIFRASGESLDRR